MSLILLNVLMILFGLPLLVAPLAVVAVREVAPASADAVVFAFGGWG